MKRILVLDVGGTNLKLFMTGDVKPTKVPSGPRFTPRALVAAVKKVTAGRPFDAVSIGVPCVLRDGKIAADPPNLGRGWVNFNFRKALGKPVKVINDAAMQALGSYEGGTMLFLGLGTGLGTALIVDGKIAPMELGHLPYRKGEYEDYLGLRGYERFGKRKWREHVTTVAARFRAALNADYVVLGGGQVKLVKEMPEGCRKGNNANAFKGGMRLWAEPKVRRPRTGTPARKAPWTTNPSAA